MSNKINRSKGNSLNKQLHDALLNISEDGDIRQNKILLKDEGIDADVLIKNSLNKIDQYRVALESKVKLESDNNLFDNVKSKINQLLANSPERASQFLTGYFKQHSVPIQFGTMAKFDQEFLVQAKDKIDLQDLSKKLDDKNLLK